MLLNILYLTTFYPPYSFGGDAVYLHRLAHALGDHGHHVDVIHCVDSYHLQHPQNPEATVASHPNVTVHSLRSGFGWLSPLLTHQTGRPWLKKRRILEILGSKRFDVVHFHNTSLLGPGALTLIPRDATSVVLYPAHEHWLVCPMHVLWKFNQRPCEKPACVRCSVLGGRPPQLWRYTGSLEKAGRHVDRFVTPSRYTARVHAERGFPFPLHYLPSFVDRADDDWKTSQPSPHDRPYFLYVGRLETIKGLQTVIPLWGRIADADLLIAGCGSQEPHLRALAGSNPRIRFLGQVSQEELGACYVSAHACIVPSLTYEVCPLVSIESFARKTPVIVRDFGALPESVQESGGGLTYQTDDELLDAINRMQSSVALRRELGENGYHHFLQHWSKEAHLKSYYRLIEQTVREKSGVSSFDGQPSVFQQDCDLSS